MFEGTCNQTQLTNVILFNFFMDLRNRDDENDNTLYVSQLNLYNFKENVWHQKLNIPIDLNSYYYYPNCFPFMYNIQNLHDLYNNSKNQPVKQHKIGCYFGKLEPNMSYTPQVSNINNYHMHPENSTYIRRGSTSYINEIKNLSELYCYDNISFTPVFAKCANTQPILINNYPGMNNIRQFYKEFTPWMYNSSKYYFTDQKDNIHAQSDNSENIYNHADFYNLMCKIHNESYDDSLFSIENSFNKMLVFIKYIECYFNVSFQA